MLTQVGRALARLGIEHIPAYSPEARGRSERLNRTFQDRLVNELRVAGITTVPAANRYLHERFLATYDARFTHAPADPASAFVPLGTVDLTHILCHEETRTVAPDNTVALEGVRLQIDKQPGRRTCEGLRVLVRRHLDGGHCVWYGARCFGHYDAARPARARRRPRAAPVFARRPPTDPLARLVRVAPEPSTASRSHARPRDIASPRRHSRASIIIFARRPPIDSLAGCRRVAPEPSTAPRSQAWLAQTPPPRPGARVTPHPGCGQFTCQTHSGQFTCQTRAVNSLANNRQVARAPSFSRTRGRISRATRAM